MSNGQSLRETEIRATQERVIERGAGSRKIGGYGAVFNKPSHNLGGFVEVVEPRAFLKSEADNWPGVVARFNHKDEMLLGTTRAGTLALTLDKIGLDYTVNVPKSRDDTLELVQRGDIHQSSFSFQTYDQEFGYENGVTVRHLTSVRLIDVAPVTIPAYPDATVALRSLAVQFDADPQDVYTLAREDELRKLFRRTDNRGNRISGRQALLQLMAMKPVVPQRKPMTHSQRRKMLTDCRYPAPRKTMSERRAELTRMALPPYQTAAEIGLDENY